MMRICQVCPRFSPDIGGVETHVEEISKKLQEKGLDVDVLTTDPSGRFKRTDIVNNITVKRFRSFAPGEAYFLSLGLEKYLRQCSASYDIVHAHSYAAFPSLHAARTKSTNKLVFTPHYHQEGHTFVRSLLHVPYRLLGKEIFKKADRIICVSEYEKHLILGRFSIAEERITVIPNGIDTTEIRRYKKRSKKGRAILYVGRLEKYKGVHLLIEVLPTLDDDISLQIVGKGPYKKRLAKLVTQLGLKGRVEFSQDLARDSLLQKYADADVFALLSNHEAFGISVAEALTAGVPCIVANESALKEWIDGRNCFGIDYPVDLKELKDLIGNVIDRKVEAPNLLSWDEVAERIFDVYQNL